MMKISKFAGAMNNAANTAVFTVSFAQVNVVSMVIEARGGHSLQNRYLCCFGGPKVGVEILPKA